MVLELDGELALLIVGQAPNAIVVADAEGTIRAWNAGAERLFGHSAEEALGQSLDLVVPERFREAHWSGFRRAMASGETQYGQRLLPTRSVRKDGTTFYLEMTLAVLRDPEGRVLGALAVAQDITERRERERDQRDRLAQLEQEVRSLREGHGGPGEAR